jgi:hypothetical protein
MRSYTRIILHHNEPTAARLQRLAGKNPGPPTAGTHHQPSSPSGGKKKKIEIVLN